MSFTGDDLLEYEKRLNSLAKVMQEISFDTLLSYDYVDPTPERTYSVDEIPLLSKRHQARVKKTEKKKDNKLDTLACRCYIYLLVICVLFEFVVCFMIIFYGDMHGELTVIYLIAPANARAINLNVGFHDFF
jgi:hypothetical protein